LCPESSAYAHVLAFPADISRDTTIEKDTLFKKVDAPGGDRVVSSIAPAGLRAHLQATLSERCDELRAGLVGVATDPFALLDAIVGPAEHVIRRIPPGAQRILRVARDENASVAHLGDLVSEDPVVVRGLLRLANSTVYAGPDRPPTTSILEAIRRVGVTGVESVVLRCMVEAMFCQPGGKFQPMADLVWTHMTRTAPIGRVLAPLFGMNQDEAFLVAMMHDVGKLVVFDRLGALRTWKRREPRLSREFIDRVLGLVHESLGGITALEWGLGPVSAGAIASHHRRQVFEFSDLASQLVFSAERVDLARLSGSPIMSGGWVADGGVTVGEAEILSALTAKPH
jgi:HD-like signal output (HDOD) protein